jgi:glycosyltransferase involved in cell wall biosynthesis
VIIGIAKPEAGFTGGFEFVTQTLAAGLTDRGHDVRWLRPGSNAVRVGAAGPPPHVRERCPEFFTYVDQLAAFAAVPAEVDVVVSTQPPSQAVRGAPQVALFSHHLRVYYDLSDVMVRAGIVDASAHDVCRRALRRIDAAMYANVTTFVTPSVNVADRINRWNPGIPVSVVPQLPHRPLPSTVSKESKHVLCVSRHEFPKRTELLVAAMKLLPDLTAEMVGSGGRQGWVMQLDEGWTSDASVVTLAPEAIWLRPHPWVPVPAHARTTNVHFRGWVSDDAIDRLYALASCVVAPAFDEDYGLTALEAMAHGKPLIVCDDGGGLVETVERHDCGIVVRADHREIAAAIRRLGEDRGLAEELGERGRQAVAEMSWRSYVDAIEQILVETVS